MSWMPDDRLTFNVTVTSNIKDSTVVLIDNVLTIESVSMPPVVASSIESSRARFSVVLDL